MADELEDQGILTADLDGDGDVDLVAIDLDRDGQADIVIIDLETDDAAEEAIQELAESGALDLVAADLERDQDLIEPAPDDDFEFSETDENFEIEEAPSEEVPPEEVPIEDEEFAFDREEEAEPIDSDQDGLTDAQEAELGTNAMVADTDGDGLLDGEEDRNQDGWHDVGWETDPLKADTDRDGISDGVEDKGHDGLVLAGETDPLSADSDFDGIKDGQEDRNSDGIYDPDRGETDPTDGQSHRDSDVDAFVDDSGFAGLTSEEMDGPMDAPVDTYDDGAYEDLGMDDGGSSDPGFDDSTDY